MFTSLVIDETFKSLENLMENRFNLLKFSRGTTQSAFTYSVDLEEESFRKKVLDLDSVPEQYLHFLWNRTDISPFELKPYSFQKFSKEYLRNQDIGDVDIGHGILVRCTLAVRPISDSLLVIETFEEWLSFLVAKSISGTFQVTFGSDSFDLKFSVSITDFPFSDEKTSYRKKAFLGSFGIELIYPILYIEDMAKVVKNIKQNLYSY